MKRKIDLELSNKDSLVVKAFGEEWARFSQEFLKKHEREKIFNDYFSIFPWAELPVNAIGADIGCGSGRWAIVAASRVSYLICLDASIEALEVAKRNLINNNNVRFLLGDVGDLPFEDAELDFAYSLGVLHHVPDTQAAINNIARILKSGAPFLAYLYYAFDNRPLWFRIIWRVSDMARRGISKLPARLRFIVCELIAAVIYWPLSRSIGLLKKFNIKVNNLPLYYYWDKSFYVMRTDALDRFGTRLEHRFSKSQITEMLENAGFCNIKYSDHEPFWCVLGYKK